MKPKQLKYIINCLTDKGIGFDKGLTDEEVFQIENKFNFRFPPDLRTFLQTVLPNERGFVNWRLGLRICFEIIKLKITDFEKESICCKFVVSKS
jgi:hypothetical protein